MSLAPVAEQLSAIAELLRTGRLAALSRIVDPAPDDPASPDRVSRQRTHRQFDPPGPPDLTDADPAPQDMARLRARFADKARHIYALRRKRGAIFGNPELFGEPAWDILLDLYIAHADEKNVSVSSACIGSAAPPTTGLRWLGILARHDLVLREEDPDDQRRVLVRLSEWGLRAMDLYFASAIASTDQRAASA